MQSDDIMVNCRQCGGQARAGDFVLDPDFKMMVCPECVRRKGAGQPDQSKQPEPPKPPGWDAEDEELERLWKKRPAQRIESGMRLKCSCGYEFVFKGRRVCPYCDKRF